MDKLQEIYYNLTVIGGGYQADLLKGLIAKIILRLPEDLRDDVTTKVTFICADGVYGQYERFKPSAFQEQDGTFHFIILSLGDIQEEREIDFTIAHEIAHYILDHCGDGYSENMEDEADSLCEKWGFVIPERRKDSN